MTREELIDTINSGLIDIQVTEVGENGAFTIAFTPNKEGRFEMTVNKIYDTLIERLEKNGYILTIDLKRDLKNDLREELEKYVQ